MRLHPLRVTLLLASAGLLAALAWPAGHLKVQDLVSPDPDVSLAAIQRLHTQSAAGVDVCPELVRGLSHSDSRVRARCVRMLASLNANEHADAVAALLADPDAYVRVQVGLALRVLRGYQDPSPLLKTLADRTEWESIRVDVATSLADRREQTARPGFARVAANRAESETMRVAALRGLGAVRAERDFLLQLANSKGENARVRRTALLSLGMQNAGDFLRKVATSPDSQKHLRGDAAMALARSGTPGTRQLYADLLAGEIPLYVRSQAMRGVLLMEETLSGVEPVVRAGLVSADHEERRSAASLARESVLVELCPDLERALALETHPTTRAVIDESLRRLQSEPSIPADPDQLLLEP